ncbi:Phosphopantothenoylcysteine decarboxylase / Phosphopantothenoylcysteine synthetase [hydrothermal vent metagenome]|uniref:Phosphopantothenoylcysteine decarboxylase / Phosphopantothenoylcysteine synthetase n=1 Tax=hydrothermal vent metagenome TaxID=652676 RepID=A0A3B0UH55_9ZZZZ
MLQGKKIILGVCGGIAAYKSALLVRLLVKNGAEVQVIMTPSAHSFITPLTLSTLSNKPVLTQFQKNESGTWNNHVELGLWADLLIIAPTTASTLSKMAFGQSDNLLLTTYLSARCQVMVAPAMDLDMFQHPTTTNSLELLKKHGVAIIDAEEGELASGLEGKGRMAEPETIFDQIKGYFSPSSNLAGKRILITAGPTYEAIDPVRFIGNLSSGKMGLALALEAQKQEADVTLVIGPNSLNTNAINKVINVTSSEDMYEASSRMYESTDIAIFAAAVADYAPAKVANQKIKKQSKTILIELSKTVDIAKTLGERKKKEQFNVGFALETENEKEHAQHKLKTKKFDLIVLNSLNDKGAGFGGDTNKITIIDKQNNYKEFKLKSKTQVAKDILYEIETHI